MAQQHRPDLIVLDVELDDAGQGPLSDLLAEPSHGGTRLLLLGTLRREPAPAGHPPHAGQGEFLAKPYHYEALIRKIEQFSREFNRRGRAVSSLFVIRGNDQGSRFALDEQIATLGRDSTNRIQLRDTEVSRHHAEIPGPTAPTCWPT